MSQQVHGGFLKFNTAILAAIGGNRNLNRLAVALLANDCLYDQLLNNCTLAGFQAK